MFDFCFGMDRTALFLHGDQEAPEVKLAEFQRVVQRRLSREPLQYITGMREFWSMVFHVSPAVLVPRPETEFLLEHTLAICETYDYHPRHILDMCTGSGVIAVVLAKELDADTIIAVDQSVAALEVAVKNRDAFDLANRVQLVCSDLFSAIREDVLFDLIVSNPPYIADHDLVTLQPEVKSWEPHAALFSGKEGLDVITQLADVVHEHLCPDGWLFMEIGAEQKDKVEKMFSEHVSGAYEEVKVLDDWSGRPRVLQARKLGRRA